MLATLNIVCEVAYFTPFILLFCHYYFLQTPYTIIKIFDQNVYICLWLTSHICRAKQFAFNCINYEWPNDLWQSIRLSRNITPYCRIGGKMSWRVLYLYLFITIFILLLLTQCWYSHLYFVCIVVVMVTTGLRYEQHSIKSTSEQKCWSFKTYSTWSWRGAERRCID